MSPKLVLVTGPPGIGKTTVARLLFQSLEDSAWLDGDDVWRINPFTVNERTKKIAEANIPFVLRSYLEADYSYVILSWVLHDPALIDRILERIGALEDPPLVFTLVADEAALEARLKTDPERGPITARPFERLRQARLLETRKIDTTDRTPESIAAEILNEVKRMRYPDGGPGGPIGRT
jgi:broad-specificity NMP kinase